MAINDLSPGYITVQYSAYGLAHTHTIPVGAVTAAGGGIYQVPNRLDQPVTWTTALDAYMVAWAGIVTDQFNASFAELWVKPTPSDAPTNVGFVALDVGGDLVLNATPYTTQTLTFRTALGGRAKFVTFDSGTDGPKYQKLTSAAGLPTEVAVFRNYLTGTDSIRRGLDGSVYAAPLNWIVKQNDQALRAAQRRGEI